MRLAVVVLCALALAACSGHSSTRSAKQPPASAATTPTLSPAQITANQQAVKEVAITSCAPNSRRNVEVTGTAHNTTSSGASYTVQLSISDKSGKRLYATAASVSNVAPTKTARWDAATTAKYESGMTCAVASVSRAVQQ
jgi:hypothetical protein